MKPTYERFEALVDALMMAIEAKSEYRSFTMTRIAEQLAIGFTHEKVEEAKQEALDLVELCEDVYKTQQYKDWIKSQEATQ